MKKALPLVLAFLLVCFSSAPAHAAFTDVPNDHWAKNEIEFLTKKNIIKGYDNGRFGPRDYITRKQAVIMMMRALKLNVSNRPNPHFKDVSPTQNGYKEIAAAVDEGWFLKASSFYPDRPLTREEMARCLAKAYQLTNKGASSFKDVSTSSPYYSDIMALVSNDITSGYTKTTFGPKDPVNRAQFAVFMSRIYSKPLAYVVKRGSTTVKTFDSKDDAVEFALTSSDLTVHPVSNTVNTYPDQFLGTNSAKINNGVLIYNGFENQKSFDADFFTPYISYVKNQKPVDSLFDTFIVLGRTYSQTGSFQQTINSTGNDANYAEWKWYMDRTFSGSGVVPNLNQSASMNPVAKKVNVYLSIPYPKYRGQFVDLAGKKVPVTAASRYQLVNWYVNETMKKFQAGGYKNMELSGFYWLNETVINPEDQELVKKTSALLKSKGKQLIYSPHSRSTNFEHWQEYGFSGAYLQSNAFKVKTSLKDVQKQLHFGYLEALTYGSGINLEIDDVSLSNDIQDRITKFDEYLRLGRLYHLPGRSVIMYQGTEMIYRLGTYHSKYGERYANFQKAYDDLYAFLKNK